MEFVASPLYRGAAAVQDLCPMAVSIACGSAQEMQEGMVQNLDFDGTAVTMEEVTPHRAVTLEDIHDGVTGRTGTN